MPRREEDFTEKVKQAVARRVCYHCSNPECKTPTTGPHADAAKANNIGEAAHINGAKPGAARYNSPLSVEEIKDAYNAIWLCRTCADKIDNDEVTYPESRIREWKKKAEDEANATLGKPKSHGNDNSRQTILDNAFRTSWIITGLTAHPSML